MLGCGKFLHSPFSKEPPQDNDIAAWNRDRMYLDATMIRSIPTDLLKIAWDMFLWEGESIAAISTKTRIPNTSLFHILQGIEQQSPDFPLMRALAKGLKRDGRKPHELASAVRIQTLLANVGINPVDAESMINEFLSECYKAEWTPSEAVDNLKRFCENAEAFGNNRSEHATYVNKSVHLLHQTNQKTKEKRQELAKLIHSKEVIERNLQIFMEEGGVMISDLTLTQERDDLREQNKNLIKLLGLYRTAQTVDRRELQKLNDQLLGPVTEQQVLDMSNDVRVNPSKYSELFFTGISRLKRVEPWQDSPKKDHSVEPSATEMNSSSYLTSQKGNAVPNNLGAEVKTSRQTTN